MKKVSTGLVLLVGIILCSPLLVSANLYSGKWLPNGDTAVTINLTPGLGSLFMYDWDDGITDDLLLLLSSDVYTSVTFSNTTGEWVANNEMTDGTLVLGDNRLFGFYFY